MNEKFNQENQSLDERTAPQNLPPPEDWGMTNPLKNPIKETQRDGWKMPEPSFRVTEGYCPIKPGESYKDAVFTPPVKQSAPTDEKLSNLYAPPTREEMPDITMHNLSLSDLQYSIPAEQTAPADAVIEAQPDISEDFDAEDLDSEASDDKAESTKRGFIFTVFGITAMLLFAAAFLTLVYVLFFTDYLTR